MCGYRVVELKSNPKGQVDLKLLEEALDKDVAAFMLTNPNTLGLFEENVVRISEMVHRVGGLLYLDGANINAIMGYARPRDMGFDVVHLNLHKTFSTPHGGGGPGSGPILVTEELEPYLPVPVVERRGGHYALDYDRPLSIGRVKAFYGNFNVLVKALAYILAMGAEGLKQASFDAVLNANYLKEKLKKSYYLPYDFPCMHEFVLSGEWQAKKGVKTLDIAKRLMDFGLHPPTVYFPLNPLINTENDFGSLRFDR
ncbi:glycine dehydrogenase, partial [Candidatus Hakubella thermalkaliphila]